MPQRFTDQVAVVTGASRGIGRAIALRLASEGAHVAVTYRENGEQATAVVEELRALGRRAEAFQMDVRDDAGVRALTASVAGALGPIDVWINNAGIEHEEPLDEIQEAHWDETFAVNVKGLFFCTRAAADHMRTHKTAESPGAIVNLSSRFGELGSPNSLPYGASKAAVNNITRALAKEYAPLIRVNGVAPAFTPTDMMSHVTPEYEASFLSATPLGRITRAEDSAAAVAFLASGDAAFTTGVTLLVDGGYTLK